LLTEQNFKGSSQVIFEVKQPTWSEVTTPNGIAPDAGSNREPSENV